jgi:hypothetical protein
MPVVLFNCEGCTLRMMGPVVLGYLARSVGDVVYFLREPRRCFFPISAPASTKWNYLGSTIYPYQTLPRYRRGAACWLILDLLAFRPAWKENSPIPLRDLSAFSLLNPALLRFGFRRARGS